ALQQNGLGAGADVRGDLKPGLTLSTTGNDADRLASRDSSGDPFEYEFLAAVECEALDALSIGKQERDHADADEIRTVDALDRRRNHGADTEERRPLGCPVAAAAGTEIETTQNHERDVTLPIRFSGLSNRDHVPFWINARPPSLTTIRHSIANANA